MGTRLIEGIQITPLKVIPGELGDIYHAFKRSDEGFEGFGEAYFSNVKTGTIKGWKKHSRMILNLVVPVGAIKFVLFDDREGSPTQGMYNEFVHSLENYNRLTVPQGVWMAFQGVGNGQNMLLNIASIPHDPQESENQPLEAIQYEW
ncbi:dTDP-4-dehydrorhamnose 3,5-epimerase [Rapidithrix thailandica]|uniref:dTDP-4-dehydrorhamnose 3,5-epimerase n=1 Tax=Rapidithrix thailandica TaxID=413964 RepID=A0AAW9SBP7_9BACT